MTHIWLNWLTFAGAFWAYVTFTGAKMAQVIRHKSYSENKIGTSQNMKWHKSPMTCAILF